MTMCVTQWNEKIYLDILPLRQCHPQKLSSLIHTIMPVVPLPHPWRRPPNHSAIQQSHGTAQNAVPDERAVCATVLQVLLRCLPDYHLIRLK